MRLYLVLGALFIVMTPLHATATSIAIADPFALHLSWVNCNPECDITFGNPSLEPFSLELDVVLTPSRGTYTVPNRGPDFMLANEITAASGFYNGLAVTLGQPTAGTDGFFFNPTNYYLVKLILEGSGEITLMWDGHHKLFTPDTFAFTRLTVTPISLPEPSSLGLLMLGVLAAFLHRSMQ